jgi:hypothetical protein
MGAILLPKNNCNLLMKIINYRYQGNMSFICRISGYVKYPVSGHQLRYPPGYRILKKTGLSGQPDIQCIPSFLCISSPFSSCTPARLAIRCADKRPPTIRIFVSNTETLMLASKFDRSATRLYTLK